MRVGELAHPRLALVSANRPRLATPVPPALAPVQRLVAPVRHELGLGVRGGLAPGLLSQFGQGVLARLARGGIPVALFDVGDERRHLGVERLRACAVRDARHAELLELIERARLMLSRLVRLVRVRLLLLEERGASVGALSQLGLVFGDGCLRVAGFGGGEVSLEHVHAIRLHLQRLLAHSLDPVEVLHGQGGVVDAIREREVGIGDAKVEGLHFRVELVDLFAESALMGDGRLETLEEEVVLHPKFRHFLVVVRGGAAGGRGEQLGAYLGRLVLGVEELLLEVGVGGGELLHLVEELLHLRCQGPDVGAGGGGSLRLRERRHRAHVSDVIHRGGGRGAAGGAEHERGVAEASEGAIARGGERGDGQQ